MIFIEWLTKPHYLFTPLDVMIMTGEITLLAMAGFYLREIFVRRGRKKP